MGSINWKTGIPVFTPEPEQFGFVGIMKDGNKFVPIVYALEINEEGDMVWTYLNSGKRYKKHTAAINSAKKMSLKYGERPFGGGTYYPTINNCHHVIAYEGPITLDLLGKAALLRKT